MTPELERAVKAHNQWFGSYKKSGDLVKIQVWLTVNNGCIEFLEALTHLLFYAGWPNVFSAIPVAKDVFEKLPR